MAKSISVFTKTVSVFSSLLIFAHFVSLAVVHYISVCTLGGFCTFLNHSIYDSTAFDSSF